MKASNLSCHLHVRGSAVRVGRCLGLGIQSRLVKGDSWGFADVRLTVRPGLQLVNALPEMDMSIAYRVPAKAKLKQKSSQIITNLKEIVWKSHLFRPGSGSLEAPGAPAVARDHSAFHDGYEPL